MARHRLRRLCFLVASTCVFVASNSSALEWPYSDVYQDQVSRVEKCAKVSGFSFRQNATPNSQQLALMCADPDCSYIVNQLLGYDTSHAQRATYSAFGEPVIDYCWFFRTPGAPCQVSSIKEMLLRVKDKEASCASATGVSLLDEDSKHQQEQYLTFVQANNPCGIDCIGLVMRVWHLLDHTTCPINDRDPFESIPRALRWYCRALAADGGDDPLLLYFSTPGWPLPAPPQQPSVPQTTSASSDSAKNTEIPAPTTTSVSQAPGSVDGNERAPETTTKPTVMPSSSQSSAGDVHDNGIKEINEPLMTNSSETAPAGGRNSTATAPRTRDDARETSTLPPASVLVASSASHSALEVAGVTGVLTVILIAMLIYVRRQRVVSSNKDSVYSTVESPPPRPVIGNPHEVEAVLGLQKAFPMQQAEDIRMIGSGGYGVVYLVRDTLNNRLLASKRLVQNQITEDSKIDDFFDEIRTVSTLHHPRIVTFVGATWTNRTDVQALFEYMDGGDLRTYLDMTPMTNKWTNDKLMIAIDIADALVYVHSELPTPLVHRDLKSRNVLLSKSPLRAKLSDFGVSREVSQNESMTNGVGTSRWLAPEVILGRGDYGTACDIYSFGVVLSELDTHKIPFWDCGGNGLGSMVPEIAIMRMVALEGRQPTFSASCPLKILELARQCLAHDPLMRPRAIDVAKMLREIVESANPQ